MSVAVTKGWNVSHQRVTSADCPCRGPWPCVVCDGGLFLCKVCGGAEGSLPSHCPGAPVGADRLDQVYWGEMDYLNGRWVVGAVSPHCPAGQVSRQEHPACPTSPPPAP